MPRSGSSWAGSILGQASNALYYREPLTQTRSPEMRDKGVVVEVDERNPPPCYAEAAEAAFTGRPTFSSGIALLPYQWLDRPETRTVVVKDVNPLICAWMIQTYRPKIVFLMRHPAGIAQSFHRLGWQGERLAFMPSSSESSWARHGEFQARVLDATWRMLRDYDATHALRYEDLCMDPMARFRDVFAFAGLDWDEQIQSRIAAQSARTDNSSDYAVTKESAKVVEAWRDKVAPEDLAELRRGFMRVPVPWYQDDADW